VDLAIAGPEQIDSRTKDDTTLNELEVGLFASVIRNLRPVTVYLDACDVNAPRFGKDVRDRVGFEVEAISSHKADVKYPIVSAASIVAKVRRDYLVMKISENMGQNVGSGYPGDPVTIEFLKSYYKKNKEMPPCVRRSWKTVLNVIGDAQQSRLTEF
jgi:ribonuclease HII